MLDGQQRITSFGRYVKGQFAVKDERGMEQYFSGLNHEKQEKILSTPLLIYICEGEESEIKEWFKTINIAGVPLNEQELLNAVYSGPFVTLAKQEFSNSQNANIQKWGAYINGAANRQEILHTALEWICRKEISIGEYMSKHRYEDNINDLKLYFNTVIEWISGTFSEVHKEMKGLDWGRLYETYHGESYNPCEISKSVENLMADEAVKNKKGIFEYVLGRCSDNTLLEIRIFEESVKKTVYTKQTNEAKAKGISNCPLCACGNSNNRTKIWNLKEMDADHVTAWSKGGATNIENCQMLCKTHNKAKGNR